jgi:hypothetical protein
MRLLRRGTLTLLDRLGSPAGTRRRCRDSDAPSAAARREWAVAAWRVQRAGARGGRSERAWWMGCLWRDGCGELENTSRRSGLYRLFHRLSIITTRHPERAQHSLESPLAAGAAKRIERWHLRHPVQRLWGARAASADGRRRRTSDPSRRRRGGGAAEALYSSKGFFCTLCLHFRRPRALSAS